MSTGLQSAHNNLIVDAFRNGMQSYVPQYPTAQVAPSISATTTTGTPASGTFYSSITNRAAMPDISQDLKASFGIDRMMVQSIQLVQTEFGPAGQPVWATPNDQFGQIRFVGPGWSPGVSSNGQRATTSNVGDYAEIVFFGTGLNVLCMPYYDQFQVSIDGAAYGSNIIGSSQSSILNGRNYSSNQVVSATSGLSLGIHTARIYNVSGLDIFGFEVINANSTTNLNINPGYAYVDGLKSTLSGASSISYNASISSNTKGGRVVNYLTSQGQIGQSFTAVPSSPTYYPSTITHSGEEPVRKYSIREFGAGRQTNDDFSYPFNGSLTNAAFTLDDGTTTLAGTSIGFVTSGAAAGRLQASGTLVLTFVGTGLDIMCSEDRTGSTIGSGTQTFSIDGGTAVNWPVGPSNSGISSTNLRQVTVASGLPYGTHTFVFVTNNLANFNATFDSFIVYQPLTPSIPTGAVRLSSYNVMANFVANTTGLVNNISTGTLRKQNTREMVYTGTWGINTTDGGATNSGFQVYTTTAGAAVQYTFFGTGLDHRMILDAGGLTAVVTIAIDGTTLTSANFPSVSVSTYGGASSFSSSTGVFTGGTTGAVGGLVITGLSLGKHTITCTFSSGNYSPDCFDIITPIHSTRSNIYIDEQNTLPVGSCSISDDRQTTPIKNALPQNKAWVQAMGVTANPTTTSTSAVPCPDMSTTIKTNGGALDVAWAINIENNTVGTNLNLCVYVDGIATPYAKLVSVAAAGYSYLLSDSFSIPASAGVHKVDLYWWTSSGTMLAYSTNRNIRVKEL